MQGTLLHLIYLITSDALSCPPHAQARGKKTKKKIFSKLLNLSADISKFASALVDCMELMMLVARLSANIFHGHLLTAYGAGNYCYLPLLSSLWVLAVHSISLP